MRKPKDIYQYHLSRVGESDDRAAVVVNGAWLQWQPRLLSEH